MNADGTGVIQLTMNNSEDFYQTWSPDGSEIAFVSDRDRNYEVYKINADGSGASVNLTNHPGDDLYPMWSPVE